MFVALAAATLAMGLYPAMATDVTATAVEGLLARVAEARS